MSVYIFMTVFVMETTLGLLVTVRNPHGYEVNIVSKVYKSISINSNLDHENIRL